MIVEASLRAAKADKLFYVVGNAILVNVVDGSCLLVKRGADEKEAAEKWAFPGGKGEHNQIANGRVNDFFAVVALDECMQETGLSFNPAASKIIANGAFVRKDGIPVVWATVAAPYESGDVTLEQKSFSEYNWFTKETLPAAEDCIGTVRLEAEQAIDALCA